MKTDRVEVDPILLGSWVVVLRTTGNSGRRISRRGLRYDCIVTSLYHISFISVSYIPLHLVSRILLPSKEYTVALQYTVLYYMTIDMEDKLFNWYFYLGEPNYLKLKQISIDE